MQTRSVHISDDTILKIPGSDLSEIVSILNTICDHINAWSEIFTHDFDVTIRTGFPEVAEHHNPLKSRTPVEKIKIWGKYPYLSGCRTVICFELVTYSGTIHRAMINDLKFVDTRKRLNRLLNRFKKELERNGSKGNDSANTNQA